LGDLRWALADPRGAALAYWQASEIAVELDDKALLARALVGMGRTELSLDEPLAAREAFDAALEHLDRSDNRALCLAFRSTALSMLGEDDAALASAMEAREVAETLGKPQLVSSALTVLARQPYLNGDFARCEELARERLDLLADAYLPIEAARARADLAEAFFRQGRVELAEQEALAAMAEFEELGLERERVALEVACVLTQVALSREDLADAELRMQHLAQIASRIQQRVGDAHAASALRAQGSLSTVAQLAHDLTALRASRATDPEARQAALSEGLLQAGQWKGRELAAGLQSVRRPGGDAEASRLLQERRRLLAERDAVVAALLAGVVDGRSANDMAELSATARSLDDQAEDVANSLAQHSPRDASLENFGSWGLEELRASMRPDEVYVEFVEGLQQLYSFVVSDDRATFHDLGPLEQRRAEINEFVAGLSQRDQLAEAATVARTGLDLWKALMGPDAPELFAAGSRLIIIPSGSLASLPFEALVLDSENDPKNFEDLEFVLDRHEVVYASSGPVFAALQASSPRAVPGRALVLGDPVYDAPSTSTVRGSRDPRQLGFTRLPGTREEALGLVDVLLEATGSTVDEEVLNKLERRKSDPGDDVLLDLPLLRLALGNNVTPEVLQGDLREFGLIHCATHGHMDVHDPGLTGLALSPSELDDGFVTASDVLELSLDADLAVLSACETARGRQRRGEGTLSLSRAFLYAGARSVVSSMWQVDDRETERTMEVFYDGILRDGRTIPASLREARLMIRNGKAAPDAFRGVGRGSLLGGARRKPGGRSELAGHPYFWAPFIYVGPTQMRLRTGDTGAVGR
jgi:CHAT domain-containing protein